MPFKREEVIAEYARAALETEEFRKVMWGTAESMYNRFLAALEEIPFSKKKHWLDVGCGTGGFQAMVKKHFPALSATAIDISDAQLDYAASRGDITGVDFCNSCFLDYEEKGFDILTCIGVLQKTNITPDDFFEHAYGRLSDGGSIWVDTKNSQWKGFLSADADKPDESINWFCPQSLIKSAQDAGFRDVLVRGFLLEERLMVTPEHSHVIVLTASK